MNTKNNDVFVYGTLSFPEIISTLLGRVVSGAPARIDGYKRIRVKDKVYPGLVAGSDSVEGVLHQDLSDEDLALLDVFEDDFYKRITTTVQLIGNQEVVASAYIIPEENLSFATAEVWDREGFGKQHIPRYLDMVSKYRQDYLAGRARPQEF